MDYRFLLKKYLHFLHTFAEGSFSFDTVTDRLYDYDPSEHPFTDAEWKELERINKEKD